MPGYRVESFVIEHPEALEPEWINLQKRANGSYFQSWGWIETWLKQIAIELRPVVIKVWSDESLVGLGLLVSADIKRHLFVRTKAMYLNEYPLKGKNMVIEYNGLLAENGCEQAVYVQTIKHLLNLKKQNRHDEFYFSAIEEGSAVDFLRTFKDKHASVILNEKSLSWQVNLTKIGAGLNGYLASLSKNRRTQIKRSLRLYEQQAPLNLCRANTLQEALDYFDGLKILHTKRWQSKGEQGSFANPQWVDFHKALIQTRFQQGEIQLLKVDHAGTTIGYLYNFIWNQCVYVLQTGFDVPLDKRLMPGYVVHALAINYNKAQGMTTYDLMHGDSLYKRLLCNQSKKLYWMVLQRKRLKFAVENLATALVRRLKH